MGRKRKRPIEDQNQNQVTVTGPIKKEIKKARKKRKVQKAKKDRTEELKAKYPIQTDNFQDECITQKRHVDKLLKDVDEARERGLEVSTQVVRIVQKKRRGKSKEVTHAVIAKKISDCERQLKNILRLTQQMREELVKLSENYQLMHGSFQSSLSSMHRHALKTKRGDMEYRARVDGGLPLIPDEFH